MIPQGKTAKQVAVTASNSSTFGEHQEKDKTSSARFSVMLGGTFMVAGTAIGAGMLGLPVRTAAGGFFPSVALLILVWAVMTFTALAMLEVALSCPGETNLITMATRYLGPWGGRIVWLCYLFFLYSVMAAYTAGGTTMVADLCAIPLHRHPVPLPAAMAAFALPFALLVYRGARWVDIANRCLVILFAAAFGMIIYFVSDGGTGAIPADGNPKYLPAAFPLLVTSFGFHLLIPTLKTYMKENVARLRAAVIAGSLVPLLAYLVWQYIVMTSIPAGGPGGLVSMLLSDANPGELVMEAMGRGRGMKFSVALFSIMALSSLFAGVSLGIFDFFADGLSIRKNSRGRITLCVFTFLPPLLYALIAPGGFMAALNYAGIFASVLLIVYPVLMAWRRRYVEQAAGGYQVAGGRTGLAIAFLFGVGVILLDIACQVHLLPVPHL
ncbi:MAG TPA: hypothetical protein ENN35_07645 [Deltaproteobacteria bacterium]|nr:hypothetical protein [Deltaproteobacteria bacterium]